MARKTAAKKKVVEKTPRKAAAPKRKVTRIATKKEERRQERFNTHIKKICETRAKGVRYEAEAMLQMYKLYQMPSIWRGSPGDKFEAVVIQEKLLCTVSRWRAFLKAVEHPNITKTHITTLGIPAICLIVKQTQRRQWRLLQRALKFRKDHDVEPTYQFITQLIGPRKKSAKPSRRELLKYIEDLKAVVLKAGGRVPSMERF